MDVSGRSPKAAEAEVVLETNIGKPVEVVAASAGGETNMLEVTELEKVDVDIGAKPELRGEDVAAKGDPDEAVSVIES